MYFGLETTTVPQWVSIAVLPTPTGLLDERRKQSTGRVSPHGEGSAETLNFPSKVLRLLWLAGLDGLGHSKLPDICRLGPPCSSQASLLGSFF